MTSLTSRLFLLTSAAALAACATTEPVPPTDMSVPAVTAAFETDPVKTGGDAADDPAIWLGGPEPLILGTDKKAGLYVYDLSGAVVDFLPTGNLNNVDLRPAAEGKGVAVASNRSDDTVVVFDLNGASVTEAGRFPAIRPEPYGICLGATPLGALAAVTHKGGEVDLYLIDRADLANTKLTFTLELGEQLEGCVFDEAYGHLYVGREEGGINRYTFGLETLDLSNEEVLDVVDSENGITSDIEGLSLYMTGNEGYLVASSQGNNTYALYDRVSGAFVGRFRVADGVVDGTEETDGLDVTSMALPGYPKGVLVVQDGFNDAGAETQNFKVIDWREIERALDLN